MQTVISGNDVTKVAEIKRQAAKLGATSTHVDGTWESAKQITAEGKKKKLAGGFTANQTVALDLKNQWSLLEGPEGSKIAVRLLEGNDVSVTLEHPEVAVTAPVTEDATEESEFTDEEEEEDEEEE